MKIEWKQLKSLSVETKSGVVLGRVQNLILETDGQNILQYKVGGLFGKKYLISREQVLSIDSEKMLVEDNVLEIKIENKDEIKIGVGSADVGVAMRENGN